MKALLIGITLLFLAGCAGIPSSTLDALATAGGGCAKSSGLWGTLLVMMGNADKGTLRNGEVSVSAECGGITIRDAATVRAVPPVPGTVTTIMTPATTTTTVTPVKPSP